MLFHTSGEVIKIKFGGRFCQIAVKTDDLPKRLFGTCFFQWLPTTDLRASALKLAYTDTAACNCVNFRGENGKKTSKYLLC